MLRPLTETSCLRAGFEGRAGSVRNVHPPPPNLDPERFTMPGTLHTGGMCSMHFKFPRKPTIPVEAQKLTCLWEMQRWISIRNVPTGKTGGLLFPVIFCGEKRQAKSIYYLPPNQNVWYFWVAPRLQSLSGVQIHFKMTDLQRIFRLLHGGAESTCIAGDFLHEHDQFC